jgi:diguanylate cyclase (GGDEF)-like protein
MVLLEDADEQGARIAAARIRAALGKAAVPTDRGLLRVTVSIGLAMVRPDETDLDSGLVLADAALYDAKRAGRDQVASR